ncbi:MAG: HAD family hydrolase [Candidatus Thermoplasmatota archaeon]|jgi:putative hydrolase of the HAD superfamily|nr:HAD family hydrolase [Candidatus Thermoplasmatota archaeon]
MIKTISFDLDDTLIKRTFADAVWLKGLPKIYAQEKNIKFEEAKQHLLKEYDKVTDKKTEWYDISYWFDKFNLKHSWKKLLENYKHIIEPYPEVPDVLKRLHKKYDLIVISNAKKEFIDIELKESGLKKYFTHVFSSTSDFHKVKKIAEFYLMICDKLRIEPNEMIHIGDHKEFDYQIPKKVGIRSFYLKREGKNKEKFTVSNLLEFEKRINDVT